VQRNPGTVTSLMVVFADCLRALTPHVSKVGITWKDGEAYDDWDAIAQSLYTGVVNNTIAYCVEGKGFRALTPYGLVRPDYGDCSYLFGTDLGHSAPFLYLEGKDKPFDTAVFVKLDLAGKPMKEMLRKPLTDCRLVALLRSETQQCELQEVVLDERS
jgi:hypothetical protein